MIKTKNIIQNRCKKDHFNYVNDLPAKRQTSLYKKQICYKNIRNHSLNQRHFQNFPKLNNQLLVLNPKNLQHKVTSKSFLQPLSSMYKSSFQNSQNLKPPIRAHEQESSFKKQTHFQHLQSTYNRMSLKIKDENRDIYSIEKGKKRSDNLGIPKYNKLQCNSIYKIHFNKKKIDKLPLIQLKEQQKETKFGNKRSSTIRQLELLRQ